MKRIRYSYLAEDGSLYQAELDHSAANEVLAKQEALNGEVTLVEVADEERIPSPQDDIDAMLIEHEYRLTLLELGLTEMEV